MATQYQYDNTNRGALFRNDRKVKDNHPDYTGTLNVDGKEFWISAWSKVGQKGPFLSISLTSKDNAATTVKAAQQGDMLLPTPVSGRQGETKKPPVDCAVDDGDDIPF